MPSTEHSLSQISPEEQERRREAVGYAVGSVMLEGFNPTPEMNALYSRYIAGELTIDELVAEGLEIAGKT